MVNSLRIVNPKIPQPRPHQIPLRLNEFRASRIGKRGDVYNTHFTKAVQLGDWLKTPNPIALRTLYCPSPSETATLGIAWLSRTSAKAIVEAADTRSESKSQDYSSAAGVISSGSRDISDLSG
jgi:hypothetical protein